MRLGSFRSGLFFFRLAWFAFVVSDDECRKFSLLSLCCLTVSSTLYWVSRDGPVVILGVLIINSFASSDHLDVGGIVCSILLIHRLDRDVRLVASSCLLLRGGVEFAGSISCFLLCSIEFVLKLNALLEFLQQSALSP